MPLAFVGHMVAAAAKKNGVEHVERPQDYDKMFAQLEALKKSVGGDLGKLRAKDR